MSRHSSGGRASSGAGRLFFAAVTMLVIGVFQLLVGLAVLARDEFFVATVNYLYVLDIYAWGWLHLGLGALLILTGIGLFTAATWVRIVGVVLAALSAIANFLFIPYYPTWSLLIIALDMILIWAISTGLTRIDRDEPPPAAATSASTPDRWTARNEKPPSPEAHPPWTPQPTTQPEPATPPPIPSHRLASPIPPAARPADLKPTLDPPRTHPAATRQT